MSLSTQVLSMSASIAAAILALVSAVYAVRLTTRTSKEVEVLKASLARESAIDEARRNYEYEARKRVYTECEPLVLRLAESSDYGASRIISLSDSRRWDELRATRNTSSFWMLGKSSEVISMAHALLEPLGLYTLLSEKVTLVDLTFDHRLSEIYTLARAAYQVHMDDYRIAAMLPTLGYNPVVAGWRQKREMNPATYWWQGLTRARLDPAVELCINRDADRVMTISEFEDRYLKLFDAPQDSRSKSLGLFCNPLYNFRPEYRPVYWRMLMCQLLIYRRISHRSRLPAEVLTSPHFDFDRQDIDSLQRSGAIEDEFLNSSLNVALQYTGALLKRD